MWPFAIRCTYNHQLILVSSCLWQRFIASTPHSELGFKLLNFPATIMPFALSAHRHGERASSKVTGVDRHASYPSFARNFVWPEHWTGSVQIHYPDFPTELLSKINKFLQSLLFFVSSLVCQLLAGMREGAFRLCNISFPSLQIKEIFRNLNKNQKSFPLYEYRIF